MADTTIVLASALQKYPHLMAIHDIIRDRFSALPVEKVLIYLIDFVDEDALGVLAAQFNVLGYKGYFLATTTQEKRAIIKRAIDLQRWKGTPYSIKEALREFGFPNALIQEGTGNAIKYDGVYTYNGTQTYGDTYHWANFDVSWDISQFPSGLTAAQIEAIFRIIMEYKNVRSNLRNLHLRVSPAETITLTEQFTLNIL